MKKVSDQNLYLIDELDEFSSSYNQLDSTESPDKSSISNANLTQRLHTIHEGGSSVTDSFFRLNKKISRLDASRNNTGLTELSINLSRKSGSDILNES